MTVYITNAKTNIHICNLVIIRTKMMSLLLLLLFSCDNNGHLYA